MHGIFARRADDAALRWPARGYFVDPYQHRGVWNLFQWTPVQGAADRRLTSLAPLPQNDPQDFAMSNYRSFGLITVLLFAVSAPLSVSAREFKVDCDSVEDCMTKGDMLTKKRKLSLALEAYRNAIKFDVGNEDAWRKFEKITVRISEEGGC
jgi:hypothetical protein